MWHFFCFLRGLLCFLRVWQITVVVKYSCPYLKSDVSRKRRDIHHDATSATRVQFPPDRVVGSCSMDHTKLLAHASHGSSHRSYFLVASATTCGTLRDRVRSWYTWILPWNVFWKRLGEVVDLKLAHTNFFALYQSPPTFVRERSPRIDHYGEHCYTTVFDP